MAHESTEQDWIEVLSTLPFPVAVLDAECRFVLLNRASTADPVLARSHIGETDLACCGDEPAFQEQAHVRHRQYEQSLQAQEPRAFEEESTTGDGRQHPQWICIPVNTAKQARLIVVGIYPDPVVQRESEGLPRLVQKINRELRAPLAALVGQAGILAQGLSGEQQTRASLIDQSGQRLLKRLSLLMKAAEQPPLSYLKR